jgi:hypothetical protein
MIMDAMNVPNAEKKWLMGNALKRINRGARVNNWSG